MLHEGAEIETMENRKSKWDARAWTKTEYEEYVCNYLRVGVKRKLTSRKRKICHCFGWKGKEMKKKASLHSFST